MQVKTISSTLHKLQLAKKVFSSLKTTQKIANYNQYPKSNLKTSLFQKQVFSRFSTQQNPLKIVQLQQLEQEVQELQQNDPHFQKATEILGKMEDVISLKEEIFQTKFYEKWENNHLNLIHYLYNLGKHKDAREKANFILDNLPTEQEQQLMQKIHVIEQLSYWEGQFGSSEFALKWIEDGIKSVEKINHFQKQAIQASLTRTKGQLLFGKGEFEKALTEFSNVVDIYEKLLEEAKNNEEQSHYFKIKICQTFSQAGLMCYEMQGLEQSLILYEKSYNFWKNIAQKADNLEYLNTVYMLGQIETDIGNMKKAEQYLLECESDLLQIENEQSVNFLISTQLALQNIFSKTKNYQKAEEYIQKLDQLAEQYKQIFRLDLQCQLKYQQAEQYLKQEKWNEGLKAAEWGIRTVEKHQRQFEPIYAKLQYVAGMINATKDNYQYQMAKKSGDYCLQFSQIQQSEVNEHKANGERILGIIYLRDGNNDLAFEYLLNAVAGYSQIASKLNFEFLETLDLIEQQAKYFQRTDVLEELEEFKAIKQIVLQNQSENQ